MTDTERLSPLALRRLNKTLARVGLRICRSHQGHPLPLDEQHFYRVNAGKLDSECRTCQKRRSVQRRRTRYRSDPVYRANVRAKQQRYADQNREHVRAIKAASRQRCKAAKFASLLAGVTL